MISRIFQNRKMSPKYFNLILFYIFTTSFIIIDKNKGTEGAWAREIISGLNIEGVSSGDESKEDKSREKKGKNQSENTQNSAENLKTIHKTGVEKERQNGSTSSSTSVKSTEEALYTTAELALITVLENACSDLKIGDLMNAGSVSRSLNKIAERENSNRGLERALLPSIYSRKISNATSDFHVYNVLYTKPSVAILFIAPLGRRRPSRYRDLEERTVAVYRKFFPQHLVTIGVDASMMDECNILSCPAFVVPPNGILGLFMPLHKDIRIKVSSCSNLARFDPFHCTAQIINDLGLDSSKEKSTIIILGNNFGFYVIEDVLKLIKSSLIHKSYSLWGSLYKNTIIHSKTKDDIRGEESMIFALNLSGSNIKSWSIFFDLGIGELHELTKKLLLFKESLKLQRNTIGLVCGPELVDKEIHPRSTFTTNTQLMDSVKQIFPNIPFIGTFNFIYEYQIGVNSFSDDNNQQLIGSNSLSLMIITHD